MAGGPSVNILIAFLLFWLLFGAYGERTSVPSPGQPELASVSECVLPVDREGGECTPEDPVAPANEAGLKSAEARARSPLAVRARPQ